MQRHCWAGAHEHLCARGIPVALSLLSQCLTSLRHVLVLRCPTLPSRMCALRVYQVLAMRRQEELRRKMQFEFRTGNNKEAERIKAMLEPET